MARGRGAIPKYGEWVTLDHAGYDRHLSQSVYVSKRDSSWFIRSDRSSKKWWIFFTMPKNGDNYSRYDPVIASRVSDAFPSLTVAMEMLTMGLNLGIYQEITAGT